jgi:hypothetical protein
MKESRVFGAPIAMHRKGETTDAVVLEEIMKKPGATISEIANGLGWSNGKVDGSINRLVSEGKASVKHCLKRSMLVKMVYPSEFERKPRNLVEIPAEMVNYDLWKETAVVYSLSRSTIGISRKEIEGWNEKAFSKESVTIRKENEKVILEFPGKIIDFYQLENSDISLSTIGDLVLVTVESILPVKLPAEYPEESKFAITRHRMIIESETIEGVASYSSPFTFLSKGEAKRITLPADLRAMVQKRRQNKVVSTTSTSEPCYEPIKIPIEVR